MMRDENVGAILVLEGGKPAGIITDRDLVLRCISEREDYTEKPVREFMTEDVECVGLDEGIQNVVERMRDGEIRRVAVVDDAGRAVGLLSFGDIFALLAREMGDLSTATTSSRSQKAVRAMLAAA
jgi:CBS domain-containing protein